MASIDGHRGVYAGLKEGRDIHLFCGAKEYQERARAILNTRGHRRDLYRGAQLVLQWPRLYTNLATVAGVKPLLYYR